jgi:glycosyltransferase involved in cell wall biosynthesis
MKFSICIPQYNRIDFLIQSLHFLECQNHSNFEVVVSDDCSTDNTEEVISGLKNSYNFPIIYHRFDLNRGYDRNLRKSMELATGDYCFVLGNDDTLAHDDVLSELELFLKKHDFPDLGFCNYCEFSDASKITRRALGTGIIGKGPDIALRNYSSFSFVAGLIFKKSTFDRFNTDRFDKSIYAQIALALNMICNNAVLFSIDKPCVRKDITISNSGEEIKSNSYRDFINRKWYAIQAADGGLKSVINVLCTVLESNNLLTNPRLNYIFSKILFNTYPYWVIDYKYNNATPASIGLFLGLQPWKINHFNKMSLFLKTKFIIGFQLVTLVALLTPSKLFFTFKEQIYTWMKRK